MLSFNEEKHLYLWNGKPVPSVTQVMGRVATKKDDDGPWNAISGNFIVGGDTASNFGRAFHKVAEIICQGKKCTYDPVLEPWVKGLRKFLSDHPELEITKTEIQLYSKMYNFAGTMDILGYYKGVPIIIDWKTSTGISKTWNMQTAAYEQLVNENFNERKILHHRWAVQIKEKDYHPEKRWNHRTDFNKFLSILNVYKSFA